LIFIEIVTKQMIVEEAIVNESLTLLIGTLKPNPCDFLP
jgi:hypothetical protein